MQQQQQLAINGMVVLLILIAGNCRSFALGAVEEVTPIDQYKEGPNDGLNVYLNPSVLADDLEMSDGNELASNELLASILAEQEDQLEKRNWNKLRGNVGKRESPFGWNSLNLKAGKRSPAQGWNKMNNLWGKRAPQWNSMNGMWGKRSSQWNQLNGGWGKRSTPHWNSLRGMWGK